MQNPSARERARNEVAACEHHHGPAGARWPSPAQLNIQGTARSERESSENAEVPSRHFSAASPADYASGQINRIATQLAANVQNPCWQPVFTIISLCFIGA
jgi:hypothetical protein